jgi:hypothetical protein
MVWLSEIEFYRCPPGSVIMAQDPQKFLNSGHRTRIKVTVGASKP